MRQARWRHAFSRQLPRSVSVSAPRSVSVLEIAWTSSAVHILDVHVHILSTSPMSMSTFHPQVQDRRWYTHPRCSTCAFRPHHRCSTSPMSTFHPQVHDIVLSMTSKSERWNQMRIHLKRRNTHLYIYIYIFIFVAFCVVCVFHEPFHLFVN